MGKGIRISPKYGLNPAMTVCFWCAKPNGVALMGRITGGKRGGDIEAPGYVFGGYEPCDECKKNMSMGATLMEAATQPCFDGQPEMQKGVYPTGRWIVVTRDAAKRIFNLDGGKAFVDVETFNRFPV